MPRAPSDPGGSTALHPRRALLHPLWLGALAVYALNDHVLKGGGVVPGVVTGKLSDVGVLLVTPAVLATLLGVRQRTGWVAAHVAMGALFVALELSDGFTAVWREVVGLLGFGWVTWRDATDLLTLPALAVSHAVLGRAAARPIAARPVLRGRARHVVEVVLVACCSLLCLATSSVQCPQGPVVDPDRDRDGEPWSVDCDDDDPGRRHGLPEIPADGIDQDCDGRDATVREIACEASPSASPGATVTLDTRGAPREPAVACGGDAAGATRVVRLWPPSGQGAGVGWLDVEVASSAPHAVAIVRGCDDRGVLACGEGAARALVLVGQPAYVVVRALGEGAEVAVTSRFEPVLCGDGLVVAPETCDDGNRTPGDGCDASCRSEATP